MIISIPKNKQLILFDGVCNLCIASVQYIIEHDRKNLFLFAPLQGKLGKKLTEYHQIDTSKIDSIILYSSENGVHYKSTAALKIASKLGFPNSLLSVFLIIPTFIRNWVYDGIAKNRYRWFGKKETCMAPTPELKKKFLD